MLHREIGIDCNCYRVMKLLNLNNDQIFLDAYQLTPCFTSGQAWSRRTKIFENFMLKSISAQFESRYMKFSWTNLQCLLNIQINPCHRSQKKTDIKNIKVGNVFVLEDTLIVAPGLL